MKGGGMSTITFGSLFAGLGGMDLGLESAGIKCRWQVEIDPFCQKVLAKHWPHVKRYGDITKLDGTELEPVDLICGGFPCQDLSVAGKRAGIEGSRSGLWFEYARLLGVLRPRYVLVENVSGLLVHGAMRRVVGELARLGYVGIWRSFRASDFEASHLRKRIFIVAYSESGRRGELREPSGRSGDGRGDLVNSIGTRWAASGVGCDKHSGCEHQKGCRSMADASDGQFQESGWGSEGRDGAGSTGPDLLSNASGERLSDAQQEGVLGSGRREEGRTVAELCGAFAPGPSDPRWQSILIERPDLAPSIESPVRGMAHGLPDWLDRAMSNRTKRLSRLGNAVVPQIAEWIGRQIVFGLQHARESRFDESGRSV